MAALDHCPQPTAFLIGIFKILAKRGIPRDQLTLVDFVRAVCEYQRRHPNTVIPSELKGLLRITDPSAAASFRRWWRRIMLPLATIDPRCWLFFARHFQELSDIEEEGIRSGEYEERLNFFNRHGKCLERGIDFDFVAGYAGPFFCLATGIDDRIEKYEMRWGDFWIVLLSWHLGERPRCIRGLFKDMADMFLQLALHCSRDLPISEDTPKLSKIEPTEQKQLPGKAERRAHRGDIRLLQSEDGSLLEYVSRQVAKAYLGIGTRQLQNLLAGGTLVKDHSIFNYRISVESLITYVPSVQYNAITRNFLNLPA
jgi:hypothetical protein